MRSIWNESDRHELTSRLARLGPNDIPAWGKMNAPQMLAHITDWIRMAIGDMKVESKNTPFRFSPLKEILIYGIPIPRNLPTAPELIKNQPGVWTEEMHHVKDLLNKAAAMHSKPNTRWPEHPAFGRISGHAWGVLGYRHTDHHLRQFRV